MTHPAPATALRDRKAPDLGATKLEIAAVLQPTSALGIHTLAASAPAAR